MGGLGVQSANALARLDEVGKVVSLGPSGAGHTASASRAQATPHRSSPSPVKPWMRRYTSLRWARGKAQELTDRAIGKWAAGELDALRPNFCYAFTQVALETLEWAKRTGTPSMLESPNGHIRNFRDVYDREARAWCGGRYRGHPTWEMVHRVEEEYELADSIRVSSEWARSSLILGGVAPEKIAVFQQSVDLERFCPSVRELSACSGRLKICFVGSLDLRKGFVYLLRAMRTIGADRVCIEIAGATGDRCSAELFRRERKGLVVNQRVGDPIPVYHGAEILAFPTLEDGSPFAVAEAMSCGLPVIVTDACGAAEWVTEGINGWVVKATDFRSMAEALESAITRRAELPFMGEKARVSTELRVSHESQSRLATWVRQAAGMT